MKRNSPIVSYLFCAIMFVFGCIAMLSNYNALFSDVERDLASGRTLLLDQSVQPDSISRLLLDGGYLDDPADAAYISSWLAGHIASEGIPGNLGELNRPNFKLNAGDASSHGGERLRARVKADYRNLGMDEEWLDACKSNLSSDFGNGPATITVNISNSKKAAGAPLSGITVRLREHRIDSIGNNKGKTDGKEPVVVVETLGYAVTDASGQARFHLTPGHSYSIVPIAPGYEYGREKGTTYTGQLGKDGLTLNFRQQPHLITPFDLFTYQALKSDRTFIVRTPAQFKNSLVGGGAIFLVSWLLFFAFLTARDRKMKTMTDYLLVTTIMVLTAIGLLAMYAMTNPLNDKAYGFNMAVALAVGLIVMGLVSAINPTRLFAGKSRLQCGVVPFDPLDRIFRHSKKRSLECGPRISFSTGFSYLVCAIALIITLGLFGTGPEGSDARVNLGGFQPSEICKYLILIFVAAFFAENGMLLQAFSAKLTPLAARRKAGVVCVIVAVMLGLMMLYLLVLSDMGPALVILVTFILLYSMARRDFAWLLLGLFTFIGMMLAAQAVNSSLPTLLIASGLWFAGWLAFGWIRSRQIHESAIIINLLIIVFALGGPVLNALGAESEAARLTNRTEMSWGGQWNNHVPGGDQVAQGIWSAASGGMTGMGLGNGSPSVVPAFHTDMAFTSAGEMLGFAGALLIVVCFIVLIHRSLLIGRRAAQPFTMYLAMGIGLLTGVQFLLIVFGSLGIVPLTGVTVPFLSYSRTSLIATLGAFGFVIAASRIRPSESQLEYARTFTGPITASVILFMAGAAVIVCTLANYQIFQKDATLIRPAYITNTMGARVIEYNPRINMVLNRLHAGNIYDTNGLLLATSSPDSLRTAIKQLRAAGIEPSDIRKEAHKRKSRYYSMGNHMLFMLGDAGSKKVLGYLDSDPVGFMAESRYAGELRGLPIPTTPVSLTSGRFRSDRFMPAEEKTWNLLERNYVSLLPFLEDGLYNNPKIKEFNSRRGEERDLHLTVDAKLQKMIQEDFESYFPTSRLSNLDRLRASVVILNASNGDLLTSANYPVPEQDSIIRLNDARIYGDAPFEKIPHHAPLTERDLGMTFMTAPGSTAKIITALAAFKGLGTDAARQKYFISMDEEIERSASLAGNMSMEKAVVHSSNNYFIHLLHDRNLYSGLDEIYEAVGVRLTDRDGTSVTSYFFNKGELNNSLPFSSLLNKIGREGLHSYRIATNPPPQTKDVRRLWNRNEMALAWGQGALRATPLTMARVASIVANNGRLSPTRYVKQIGKSAQPAAAPIKIVGEREASILREYMQKESQRWGALPNRPGEQTSIGGKTGTPERADRRGNKHCNDTWYICFMHSKKLNAPVAVALRLERTPGFTSSVAAETMAKCVIPTLNAAGYEIY